MSLKSHPKLPVLDVNIKLFLRASIRFAKSSKIVAYFAVSVMLHQLRQKWKVKPLQLFLILCTFAIGGSLSGYLAKVFMAYLGISNAAIYVILYVVSVTAAWPVMVLAVSIVFGQYAFFRRYVGKLFQKVFGKSDSKRQSEASKPGKNHL